MKSQAQHEILAERRVIEIGVLISLNKKKKKIINKKYFLVKKIQLDFLKFFFILNENIF